MFTQNASKTEIEGSVAENGLIAVWQERQQKILAVMPKYARAVIVWAIAGFVGSLIIRSISRAMPALPLKTVLSQELSLMDVLQTSWENLVTDFALTSFSLGGVISLVLSLFSNVVMWAFVIWSLTFIPFIAYNSYKVSQSLRNNVVTKPFKWIQLLEVSRFWGSGTEDR